MDVEKTKIVSLSNQFHKQFELICQPALLYFDVSQICFTFIDYDNKSYILHTNPKRLEHCIFNKDCVHELIVHHPDRVHTGVFIWSGCYGKKCKDLLTFADESSQVDQGISFIEKYDHGCEIVSFYGLKNNRDAINRFINEQKLVKIFIQYLEHSLKDIIPVLHKNRINLKSLDKNNLCQVKSVIPKVKIDERISFLTTIGAFSEEESHLKDIFLTPRERQCAQLCLLGFTNNDIGKVLGIQRGTVGGYIKILMQKVNVKSRKDLLSRLKLLEHIGFFIQNPQLPKNLRNYTKPGSCSFKYIPKNITRETKNIIKWG